MTPQQETSPTNCLIVIGASAGGVDALKTLFRAEVALEIAARRGGEEAEQLRKEAQAKRELAERVRAVVLELPSIGVPVSAGKNG